MKIKLATEYALYQACRKAAGRLKRDRSLTATADDAGFLTPPWLPKGQMLQVFVRTSIYDDQLLKEQPITGGLVERIPNGHASADSEKEAIAQENAINFLTELVASKRKWSVADRSRYNRVVRYIKTHK